MQSSEKRTKDLTEEEILRFNRDELEQWMKRVMARLYKLVEKKHYEQLTDRFVALCERGIDHTRKGLIELVKVIQEKWLEPAPSTHLQVVK